MNYTLIKEVIDLVEDFENEINITDKYSPRNIESFKQWLCNAQCTEGQNEPEWEGKENGRSPESIINTLVVHMNRYAKSYSKSAIHDSEFSTQEDFIYLINLKAFGGMTKMELIKKNIQEKPVGMQIINRLIAHRWVKQTNSKIDKRSKIIEITMPGLKALENQMAKIRQATQIVTGNLTYEEKMELIRLLKKLDDFHHPIFCENIESSKLLDKVLIKHFPSKALKG